ncbi:MAG TPA: YceI family protein [Flavobacterium sp.]|jgi:polyisoprenoid-binding protein YceI
MKKLILLLFAGLFLFTLSCKNEPAGEAGEARDAKAASSEAISYTVNTQESDIEWIGSKQTGKHNGTIRLSEGTVLVSEDRVEGGTFIIDMNTIAVTDLKPGDGKEDLEGHLKGLGQAEGADHFFNVGKFPTAKFEITNVTLEKGKSTVEGNLTIKETTKSVKFPAMISVSDNAVSIMSDSFVIDRTQWKVNYGSKSVFTDLGDKFVNDEIELRVHVKATR